MDKEQRALNGLATIRDKLVVFNGVRAAAFNENLTPGQALESIRAYYEAFDGDQAERAASLT